MKNILMKLKRLFRLCAVSGSTGSERIICAAVWYKEIPIKKEIL